MGAESFASPAALLLGFFFVFDADADASDEVNEEDAVHQMDKVDEAYRVHRVDLAHQADKVDGVHQVHPLDPVLQITQVSVSYTHLTLPTILLV